ncbi:MULTISPECIES: SRPBCC family protein [unclassified Streptomyces]|uniref:SRPBCC family protein n=1 Tax=unclassified Streptomyces TaxID=2593676 RepID=UPI002366EC79|nr:MULTISPECIES: SRPBCC family protein [unclassified Streptomyces]MDF3144757.1 SRPBCC family protein [Streptomyces sp. T21Q-yed]WDF41598.1 SRPBCC family protein [Streptomyces sp. T12]
MTAIREVIDVDCTPDEVYAYVTEPSHLPEWQLSAVSAEQLDPGPLHSGSRVRVTRRIGNREIPMTVQFDELDPPRSWNLHGIDGPVRPHSHGAIEPLDDGRRSRVTIDIDFEGHGVGKLLVPLVVRPQVRKELPRDEQLLKDRLERTTD